MDQKAIDLLLGLGNTDGNNINARERDGGQEGQKGKKAQTQAIFGYHWNTPCFK